MRKLLILLGILTLASCKPEVYLGPLDSPLGNWKSQASKYYFDGENVYENEECAYRAISFYKDSLCCIEGVKGAFRWTLDNDSLVVDTLAWKVVEMTGANLILDYLGIVEKTPEDTPTVTAETGDDSQPEVTDPTPADPLPVEYKGKTIETDGNSYWYAGSSGEQIRCWPVEGLDEDGKETIICWWDSRTDTYKQF